MYIRNCITMPFDKDGRHATGREYLGTSAAGTVCWCTEYEGDETESLPTTETEDEYNLRLLVDDDAKEFEVSILMEDGYTRYEAIASLAGGTMIYYPDYLECMAEDYDTTLDEIRAGNVEDMKIVTYDGREYGIAVVH